MTDLHHVNDQSLWLFVCSSTEPRHFLDIVYGFKAIAAKGVPSKNIVVFVDDLAADLYLSPFGVSNVSPLSSFVSTLATTKGYSSVVAIVGGHGSLNGIGGPPSPLSASPFIDAIRSIPDIVFGVVVLTQCFGGVFNYVSANMQPELAFVGATSLHPSFSLGLSLKNPISSSDPKIRLKDWSANIFSFSFFEWLSSPTDVDGDKVVSLVDAFKYSGTISNEFLRDLKIQLFQESQKLSRDLHDAEQGVKRGTVKRVQVDAIRKKLQEVLEPLHTSQDPWILHANLARKIVFW